MAKLGKMIGLAMESLACLCLAGSMYAQTTTGQINGTVKDSTGAVISDATVTARNTETHAARTAQTGPNGEYLITLLPVGNYELDVKKNGFSPLTARSIKLDVSQSLTINPSLSIGTAEVTVDVQGDSEMLNYSNSALGTTIAQKVVNDLPLNGRNFTQLLTLVPGATPISTSQGANIGTDDGSTVAIPGSSFSNPSINGQQNREVLYLLDGVVNTDFRTTTYTVLPIVDGINQFKVQSHNDDPAFGSVLGGVVNLITKSGTNKFHGSVWEFIRNSAFNARNPFADVNADGSPRKVGAFHQNEFGGAIGGPVWIPKLYNGTDKTFFFFAYEGWRYNSPVNSLYNVPTDAEIGGNFQGSVGNPKIFDPTTTAVNGAGTGYTRQAFSNSIIPNNRISTQMQSYIQTYFDRPNLTGNPNYNELLAASASNNSSNYQGRFDQIVTKKDTIFFRWSNMFDTVNNPATHKVSNLTDFGGLNIGAGITHVFTPKLVVNVNGGRASRAFSFNNISTPGLGPLATEGFTGLSLYGPVAVNLASPYGGSALGSAALRRNSSWSVAGVLNAQIGRHSLNFGTTYIDQYRSQHGTGQNFNFANDQTSDPNNPATTGNSLASALLGYPVAAGFQAQNTIKFSIPTYAIFAGDQWKVTNKLSLNLGMRYDHLNQPTITSGMNNGFNFDTGNWEIGGGVLPAACITSGVAPCIPGSSTSAATDLAAVIGDDGSVAGSHIIVSASSTRAPASVNMDFGPRFGFAYTFNPTMVLRGGFGIVYDTLNGLSQTLSNSVGEWPAKGSVTHNYNVLGTPLTSVAAAEVAVGSPLTTGGPFSDFDYYYSPKEKPMYSEQYNLQIEQALDRKTLLSVGYVGSVSKRLDYAGTANAATTPGAGTVAQVTARKPFPYMTTFVYDSTIGAGNYNALQAKLERQFFQGLQFLISYTWSKSTDTGTSGHFGAENGIGPAVQNYYSPESNRSVSGYDVPQFLSISSLYEFPTGKGKRYLSSGLLSYVLGGWQLNTVAQFRSGQAYTVGVAGDIANIGISGGGYGRPNLISNPHVSHPTYLKAFNTAAFAVPVLSFGNVGRNTMRGESYHNDDLSLFKHFPIGNEVTAEIRAEAFNAFNIINYGTPDNNLGDKQAGTINGIAGLPRQFQFALKLSF